MESEELRDGVLPPRARWARARQSVLVHGQTVGIALPGSTGSLFHKCDLPLLEKTFFYHLRLAAINALSIAAIVVVGQTSENAIPCPRLS